ncbi:MULTISPECIES: hypothetical protein [Vibrio harveyi group]|uniref:hypothetical protein n=1 Tax=Vibrio harveyi group TaxID=717610 RepID=UPI002480140C|nr:hypothetical protein [Vibrio harveyi]
MNEKYVPSNFSVFYQIADEAFSEMLKAEKKYRKPCEDNPERTIISYDPSRTSFKSGMKVIVFSCMALEAILHLMAGDKLSKSKLHDFDRSNYEQKLSRFNILDVADDCKRLSRIRRQLVHEQSHTKWTTDIVQVEAKFVFLFVNRLFERLGVSVS